MFVYAGYKAITKSKQKKQQKKLDEQNAQMMNEGHSSGNPAQNGQQQYGQQTQAAYQEPKYKS